MRSAPLGVGILAGFALYVPAFTCHADAGFAGAVVATSDYRFRGLSQTQGEGALQADLHYQGSSGWYVGGWVSNVNLQDGDQEQAEYAAAAVDGPREEYNIYAGFARAITPDWSARVTAVHYEYSQQRATYDYDELIVGADYQNRLFLTVASSPDISHYSYLGSAQRRADVSYELSVRQPLARGFSASVGAGLYDLHELFGISYWAANGGVAYSRGRWQLEAAYYEVSREGHNVFGGRIASNRWVATAMWRF